ncbi:MAG TPA: hypothetical protein VF458_15090 [Ktedonobacteraceae bacterium]
MTFAQVEYAEQRMQQQWHYLVMAEEAGEPREVLEQMYDLYILMAEAYNACLEKYQLQRQNRRAGNPAPRPNPPLPGPALPRQGKQQDAKLAS